MHYEQNEPKELTESTDDTRSFPVFKSLEEFFLFVQKYLDEPIELDDRNYDFA